MMNKYKIAVCDDRPEELNKICGKIGRILDNIDAGYTITKFMSGEGVADAIVNRKKKFDIVFLDILMAEVNGLVAARKIREQDEDVSIVFITGSPNFVFEGYDVQALHYILKPVDESKLTKILLYDWKKRNEKHYIDVKLKNSVCRIILDDICYLESSGRKVRIITKDGQYETYGSLSRFTDILPANRFISCHKSFVVNLDYISEISRTSFTTIYNQVIPISKACYSGAKKAFINFIGGTT